MKPKKTYLAAATALIALLFCGIPPQRGSATQNFQTAIPITQQPVLKIQDTSRDAKAIQAIEKKKDKLKIEIARAPLHSMEDVYLLQIKTFMTLEDSHKISVMELQKNDSLATLLKDTRADGLVTQRIASELSRGQVEMRAEMLTYQQFKEEVTVFENFMTRSAYIVSVLSILFWVGRVAMRKWHTNNRHRLPGLASGT
jgi:hypothetical protein